MAATDLCTLDQVKDYMSLSSSKAIDDDLIEDLITRITTQFHNYVGYQIKSTDYTEYHDGDGEPLVFPNVIPINSVTLLADDVDWEWGSDTQFSSDDYRIVDNRYVALKSSYFTSSTQNIKITYNAGYSTVPTDIVQACIEEAGRKYKHRKDFDSTSKSLDDGSTQYVEKGLMTSTKEVLNKYRILTVV
jgi:hypothetical protein